jgi:hypothetical protein
MKTEWKWLLDWIAQNGSADCLNTPLALDACERFGWRCIRTGLHTVSTPRVGRELAKMARAGYLEKSRAGISGLGYGWPKWVWTYSLTSMAAQIATETVANSAAK